MEMIRRAGFHALPVPIGEMIVARRVSHDYGLPDPDGLASIAPPGGCRDVVLKGRVLTGFLGEVPWGRDLRQLIVAIGGPDETHLAAVDCRGAVVRQGRNMAGEARDEIDLAKCKLIASKPVVDAVRIIESEGALLRAVQMSGALNAVLEHCMIWVGDRVQFGKPISKHQAIQHLMAQLAEETAAASAATDLAVQASERSTDRFAVAIAKARVGEAAGKAANLAHAIFGAMGFTREHQLHYATRRLWAWRNEFGGESYWQRELGQTIAARGGRSLWPTLSDKY
jgi:acyl-CoA dehydrogenase